MPSKPAPKQTHAYPSLRDYLNLDTSKARLQAILVDPVFLAASRYIEENSRVKTTNLTGDSAKLDTEIVRQAAIHAGVVEFTNRLTDLIADRSKNTPAEPEAWVHVHPKTD